MSPNFKFNKSAVDSWLHSEISAGHLKSGALEIKHCGKTVYSKYFCNTMADNGDPHINKDTTFWIASMTKPIVTVAAMILVDNGSLALTDPISKFIPDFGKAGVLRPDNSIEPLEKPVTILNLMTHTSGLTYGSMGDGPIHHMYNQAKTYDFEATNSEMAERLSALPLLHQPGTVFEYGMSTDILGRVIEIITRQGLDKALQQLVLDPLNMTRTGFRPSHDNQAELPSSPANNTFITKLTGRHRWYSGGAGLWSTLSDYLKFSSMLNEHGRFADRQILSCNSILQMLQNHLPANIKYGSYTDNLGITAPCTKNGLGFGLGLAVRTHQVSEIPGGVGEFFWPGISGTNFWVDPLNNLIVVFLTHASEYRCEHRLGLRNAVYKGLCHE